MLATQQDFDSNAVNDIGPSSAPMGLHSPRFASGLPDAVLFIKNPIAGPRGLVTRKTSARFFMPGNSMNRKTADDQGYSGYETA